MISGSMPECSRGDTTDFFAESADRPPSIMTHLSRISASIEPESLFLTALPGPDWVAQVD